MQSAVAEVERSPKPLAASHAPACRFCAAPLLHTFVDLGTSPLCQRHVTPAEFNRAEPFYPLHVYVCDRCWLVQLPEYVAPNEIFDDQYAYFSSFSDTMLRHAQAYVDMISAKLKLGAKSRVVEVASNDGYLLQYFVQRGIPALGIEPTSNTAAAAEKKGVPSVVKFFGRTTAREVRDEHGAADLILGNNVLAHVPDINDFVGGMKILLGDEGVITMEFPHLMRLVAENQFDTIYHEHFSYFSLYSTEKIFAAHGLRLFDVEELPTHGGSLRIYACHAENEATGESSRLRDLRAREEAAGVATLGYYASFAEQVRETKRQLLAFLIEAKREGRSIVGYGAPGKGNTLLNYCGIRTDFLDYTVDRNPYKQGRFLPGTHIPIFAPERIRETQPDYVLILPWNIKDEIVKQLSYIGEWGGRFVVPIPTTRVLEAGSR